MCRYWAACLQSLNKRYFTTYLRSRAVGENTTSFCAFAPFQTGLKYLKKPNKSMKGGYSLSDCKKKAPWLESRQRNRVKLPFTYCFFSKLHKSLQKDTFVQISSLLKLFTAAQVNLLSGTLTFSTIVKSPPPRPSRGLHLQGGGGGGWLPTASHSWELCSTASRHIKKMESNPKMHQTH